MYRNPQREAAAKTAATWLRKVSGFYDTDVGVVLGTGWGGELVLSNKIEIPFQEVPGFNSLGQLKGHARKFFIGSTPEGRSVVGLDGRGHLNEIPMDQGIYNIVRLQTETLLQLGVQTLIVTCACGGLPGMGVEVSDLFLIEEFFSLCAPDMPMWGGEFSSPNSTLVPELHALALEHGGWPGGVKKGMYAMVRGPFFEGLGDKKALATLGSSVVGMSTLPEACVASVYEGVRVLGVGFVTNDCTEHSHEQNIARAGAVSSNLGAFLTNVINNL